MKFMRNALLFALASMLFTAFASPALASPFVHEENLATVLNDRGQDGGSIVIVNNPAKATGLLKAYGANRVTGETRPVALLTGGVAESFVAGLNHEGISLFRQSETPQKTIVLRGDMVVFLKQLLSRHLKGYKGLLKREVTMILNHLKRTLTADLVQALVNGKIMPYGVVLVPFAYLIDNVKFLLLSGGLLITAAVGGALLLIEYGVLGLAKLVVAAGRGIIALAKRIIEKLRGKPKSQDPNPNPPTPPDWHPLAATYANVSLGEDGTGPTQPALAFEAYEIP